VSDRCDEIDERLYWEYMEYEQAREGAHLQQLEAEWWDFILCEMDARAIDP